MKGIEDSEKSQYQYKELGLVSKQFFLKDHLNLFCWSVNDFENIYLSLLF